MDDLSPRMSDRTERNERNEPSPLHAEWMNERFDLAAAKPAGGGGTKGPGKDVADRLDRELREFANSDNAGASSKMKEFKQLVNKFEDAADKKAAVSDFGHAASKLRVQMENEAIDTFKKAQAEADKIPGRKQLDADLSAKVERFFDQAGNLPSKEYERVLGLMEFKDGDTRETRDARVRDGIKNNPRLLKSFNEMETASDKVDQSRTPLERQLDEQHSRDIQEAKTMRAIINKVAIRVTDSDTKERAERTALREVTSNLANGIFDRSANAVAGTCFNVDAATKVPGQDYYVHANASIDVDEKGVPKPIEIGSGTTTIVPAFSKGAFRDLQLAPTVEKAVSGGSSSDLPIKLDLGQEQLSGKLRVFMSREPIAHADD